MYGRPCDSFARVVDTFTLCACGLHAVWTSQRVTAKLPIDSCAMRVAFDTLDTGDATS